ncbi:WXG100 family type VII secretion target [Bacillus thuringiensis]|uniref:WXG100 family type VII secretion target n=1 Tax=Bacillus cereus group TaxID=86661 RepID=UPI000A3036B2|nr:MULTISPECIES: WXG100 family type VII secretion target [Bacillus cereus group]PES55664.1 WXG100 family type VII secretion target [Bacillus cereus]PFA29464.1 WXG100 family type VII secretion target [Bacillus thuringiensis]PGW10638.1 WXG100 family type VII secretion target [Bacillus cereus]SME47043.1 Colicin-E9 [Bacillus cereus]
MGQVRVDPDKLEASANSMSRNREDMERVIRELLQVTFELQMSWEGMANQRFFDEFFSKKRSMDDLVKHLHHTELELKKSARTFREVDEKAYGNFNLLSNLSDAFLRGSGRATGDTIFNPLKNAWKQTSGFFGHLVDNPMEAMEDAKYGLRDIVESSIDDTKEEFRDKYEFIKDMRNNPIGTLKHEWDEEFQKMHAMRNVLSDWYVENIEYGNAESITESIAYGATTLAFWGLVTRGTGAVGNGARWGRSLPSMSEFQLGSRLETAYAYGKMNYKIDTIKPLDTYWFAKTSSAVKRNTPGAVTSSFNLERSLGTQKKLMYNDGAIGVIPQEVREKLIGREFSSFDEFRKEFWKTVAESSYAEEFNRMNKMRMMEGKAPYTPESQQYGEHKVYVLHHKQPIHQGGDVYNLDNLIIVSPKIHQTILDPSYHFGKKGL